jgi:hypothetical protein
MSAPFPDDPNSLSEEDVWRSAPQMDIELWLEGLRRFDQSLYNLMALEVWSIAQTMDHLTPGFWNRFMENRQAAVRQFIQRQSERKERREDGGGEGESKIL